jgi:tetratricopeptide (TPR) repeat protein
MRLFSWLIIAIVVALITAGGGRDAVADIVSECDSGTPDARIAACSEILRASEKGFVTGFVDWLATARAGRNANVARLYVRRGQAYLSNGEYDKAIADATKVIDMSLPDVYEQHDAYIDRGDAYRLAGEYAKAIADCSEALNLIKRWGSNPRDAYACRGLAYQANGEYDKAIADFDTVVIVSPDFLVHRGKAYESKGEHGKAMADFDKAIKIDPENADANVSRGNVYKSKGEHDTAIADFDKAIKIDPQKGRRLCLPWCRAFRSRRRLQVEW